MGSEPKTSSSEPRKFQVIPPNQDQRGDENYPAGISEGIDENLREKGVGWDDSVMA
jgi:hypothetical protein